MASARVAGGQGGEGDLLGLVAVRDGGEADDGAGKYVGQGAGERPMMVLGKKNDTWFLTLNVSNGCFDV